MCYYHPSAKPVNPPPPPPPKYPCSPVQVSCLFEKNCGCCPSRILLLHCIIPGINILRYMQYRKRGSSCLFAAQVIQRLFGDEPSAEIAVKSGAAPSPPPPFPSTPSNVKFLYECGKGYRLLVGFWCCCYIQGVSRFTIRNAESGRVR